jgi:hypothetical protein
MFFLVVYFGLMSWHNPLHFIVSAWQKSWCNIFWNYRIDLISINYYGMLPIHFTHIFSFPSWWRISLLTIHIHKNKFINGISIGTKINNQKKHVVLQEASQLKLDKYICTCNLKHIFIISSLLGEEFLCLQFIFIRINL